MISKKKINNNPLVPENVYGRSFILLDFRARCLSPVYNRPLNVHLRVYSVSSFERDGSEDASEIVQQHFQENISSATLTAEGPR